ncbi:PREDICTED: uncharacterized protein LOC105960495 [Erythranthe guttata]|uniref:uncharacterized protein LOC105960495 n=1 Tax=Erythranthe guttata TaxID=4155 RepID=UPI00064D82B7|nr:PREDICTED: uncharacterized protein LOC105960495 [Erythranthe guttata]|eukprot:XP_012840136.1 PREDICTED: uncharacterized protein LOC105960495 [Erythranthe guttata]
MYHGDEICQEKSKWLLTEMGLPNGLMPLKEIEECGFVKETGFVWLKQKKKCEHKFVKISPVQYAEPDQELIKLTGVKTKELLLWVTLSNISVDDPPPERSHSSLKTPTGQIWKKEAINEKKKAWKPFSTGFNLHFGFKKNVNIKR